MDSISSIHELIEIIKNARCTDYEIDHDLADSHIDERERLILDREHIKIYGDDLHVCIRNYTVSTLVDNDNGGMEWITRYHYWIDYCPHNDNSSGWDSLSVSNLEELYSMLCRFNLHKEHYIKKAIK